MSQCVCVCVRVCVRVRVEKEKEKEKDRVREKTQMLTTTQRVTVWCIGTMQNKTKTLTT